MTERKRLIELMRQAEFAYLDFSKMHSCEKSLTDFTADYLLENGVIVPPCKVGDKVFRVECTNRGALCGITDYECDDCPFQNRKIMQGDVIALKFVKGIVLKVKFDNYTDYFCDDEVFYTKEEAKATLNES